GRRRCRLRVRRACAGRDDARITGAARAGAGRAQRRVAVRPRAGSRGDPGDPPEAPPCPACAAGRPPPRHRGLKPSPRSPIEVPERRLRRTGSVTTGTRRAHLAPASAAGAMDAILRRGLDAQTHGRLDEAEAAYREMLEVDDGDPRAIQLLGAILVE